MSKDRASRRVPVLLSIVAAIMLTIVPLPEAMLPYRPDWVALVLIYWCLALPEREVLLHDDLADGHESGDSHPITGSVNVTQVGEPPIAIAPAGGSHEFSSSRSRLSHASHAARKRTGTMYQCESLSASR